MTTSALLDRITTDPEISGEKPIIRGRRLAVEHVLGMLAAGDDMATILAGYAWLEREDVLACLEFARRPGGPPLSPPLWAARARATAAPPDMHDRLC